CPWSACERGEALNSSKIALADAVTSIVHGKAVAEAARVEAESLFADGPVPVVREVAAGSEGIGLLDLVVAFGFSATKGEARRLVRGGAIRIDGEAVLVESAWITPRSDPFWLMAGKKKRAMVRLQESLD